MKGRVRDNVGFATGALLIFVLLILIITGFNPLRQDTKEAGATITLTVNFGGTEAQNPTVWTLKNGEWSEKAGNSSTVVFRNITAETPFEALETACTITGWEIEYKNYSYGHLVTSVNGKTNGNGGAYWQYWVNGDYASVSSDSFALSDEDSVVWSFTSSGQGRGA